MSARPIHLPAPLALRIEALARKARAHAGLDESQPPALEGMAVGLLEAACGESESVWLEFEKTIADEPETP